MLQRQLYIRLLSNLVIPVLGFWIWDWSLYFILLFYILDLLSNEVVLYLKIKKIKSIRKEPFLKVPSKIYGLVSTLFLILIIAQMNLGIALLYPGFDFQQEIWGFLSYKELGISQGLVLLPLIVMMTYSTYKMEFLIPKNYLRQEEKSVWKEHLKQHFLLLSFCAILILFSVSYRFTETIILVIILVVTTGYNYLQGKERMMYNG